jgi:hypothetical protein
MPRPISTNIQTGVDAHITEPSYLIAIAFDPPVYYSTMDAVVWDGKSWGSGGVRLEQLSERGGVLVLRNDNNLGSALVLNELTRDVEVDIYKYYNADAKWLYRLYMGGAEIGKFDVRVSLHGSRTGQRQAPRKRIIEPVFTNILAPGTTIKWGNDVLRVR